MIMRPTFLSLSGRIPALAAILTVAGGLACTEPTDPGARVNSIAILVPDSVLRPGFFMQAAAVPQNANGMPIEGKSVTWRTLTPSTVAVSDEGLILGVAPGAGTVRASVGSVSSDLVLELTNPPVASVILATDTVHLLLPIGDFALTASVFDEEDVSITGAELRWESGAARIASVSHSGLITARSVGETFVVVYAEDRSDTAVVIVTAPESPSAPIISSASPVEATPGGVLVLTGSQFAATTQGNTVLVDGIQVSVTAASATQLTLQLPGSGSFACAPAGQVIVQVTTAGGIGVGSVGLRVTDPVSLGVGQSLDVFQSGGPPCVELNHDGGRYILAVINSARALGSDSIAVTLGGLVSDSPEAVFALAPQASIGGHSIQSPRPRGQQPLSARARAHTAILEQSAGYSPPSLTSQAPSAAASLQTPALGEIVSVRVPNLGHPDFCASYTPVGARSVFVGPHVIILEDTTPVNGGEQEPVGMIDDLYADIGAQFESIVWPIAQNFGDPLAMDSRLDANGRVVLLFTRRLNAMLGGSALAATVPCDFYSRAQQPSSNVGEFVYLQLPNATEPDSLSRWFSEIRPAVAHELKHIVSFAERFARSQLLEDVWLEESTARIADELYSRAVHSYQQSTDQGFAPVIECEVGQSCVNAPRAMIPHFEALWQFLDQPANLSPLGGRQPGDFTFYGSGWSLVRWAVDHSGRAEDEFLTSMVRSGLRGVANLEAELGSTWNSIITNWALALATDGRSGFVPASSANSFPSWNLTSVFSGLCSSVGSCVGGDMSSSYFTRSHPLQPYEHAVGSFSREFHTIKGGGFAVAELVTTAGAPNQILRLTGYRGGVLPPTVRLALIRVE